MAKLEQYVTVIPTYMTMAMFSISFCYHLHCRAVSVPVNHTDSRSISMHKQYAQYGVWKFSNVYALPVHRTNER